MNMTMCEVPVHPVEYLPEADLAALPELPMTQGEDGTYYCDGESTQESTTGAQLFNKSAVTLVAGTSIEQLVTGFRISGNTRRGGCTANIQVNPQTTYYFDVDIKNNSTNPNTLGDFSPRVFIYTINSTSWAETLKYTATASERQRAIATGEDDLIKIVFGYNWIVGGTSHSDESGDAEFTNVMLSNTANVSYEPYTGNKPSPNPDYPQPIVNTYPAGTYKAICGDKTYKVVLDDDLRSVPGVADRVTIDAGRGVTKIEKKANTVELDGSMDEVWDYGAGLIYVNMRGSDIAFKKNVVCSAYPNAPRTGNISVDTDGGNGYSILIRDDKYSGDVTAYRTWLSKNPITVNYVREKPVTHQSTPPQLVTISAGRSAQITGTVNDKLDYLEVMGDSWQLVQEQGKNLFDPDKAVFSAERWSYNNGIYTATNANYFNVRENIKMNAGQVLTLSANFLFTAGMFGFSIRDSDNTEIKELTITKSGFYSISYMAETDGEFSFTFRGIGEDASGTVSDVQLELGDTATAYEPFQPKMPSTEYQSEIKDVGGKVVTSGWNLFDNSQSIARDTGYGTKKITGLTVGETYHVTYSASTNVVGGWLCINQFGNADYPNSVWIKTANGPARKEADFVAKSETMYFVTNAFANFENMGIIQVSKGEKTLYQHRGNSITLPTLRSLPDGTRDVLYADRVAKRAWVERNIGVAEFDGSADENWGLDDNHKYFSIFITGSHVGDVMSSSNKYITNRYRYSVYSWSNILVSDGFVSNIGNFYIRDLRFQTLDEWRTWLSENPVTVQYALATPAIEELPYSDYLLETAQYQTNIHFGDCDEHLQPQIVAQCKVLGR